MNDFFSSNADLDYYPSPNENIGDSLFKQYEKVIIQSLVTTFGLQFMFNDQTGGNVTTIHNAQQGIYAKKSDEYDRNVYEKGHYVPGKNGKKGSWSGNSEGKRFSGDGKNSVGAEFTRSQMDENGFLTDAYRGNRVKADTTSPDHIYSLSEFHKNGGFMLDDVKKCDFATDANNLASTDRSINQSLRDRDKKEWAESKSNGREETNAEYYGIDKQRLGEAIERGNETSRQHLPSNTEKAKYYLRNGAMDAAKAGIMLGIREVIGMVMAEVWCCISEEFEKLKGQLDLKEFFIAIGDGIKKGFAQAKAKYRELIEKFKDGMIAGILSSIATTLINIFVTTAKNVVRIIRETFKSLVEAVKILITNPENLPFIERMRAVAKVVAVGASGIAGILVEEALHDTPLGKIPVVGDLVPTFIGSLVTGILSCTLLYLLDNNVLLQKIWNGIGVVACTSTGAMIGQTLIPIPVVGTIVGLIVGYALTTEEVQNLLPWKKEENLAHEERLRIEKECNEAIEKLLDFREKMNSQINEYLTDIRDTFNSALEMAEKDFWKEDIDGFISAANAISIKLGRKPQFANFTEFKSFMNSNDNLII